jgi:hypothetical protein
VRATMELQALERVRADGGGYALALPGKDGRALHARSQDKQHRAQLVGRIAKLQALLKLAAPMQRVDPEGFKHAQQLLTRWEVEKLHSRVEEQVSALQVLRLEREQGLHGSGRNAAGLHKAAKRRRKNVMEMLAVIMTWDRTAFDAVVPEELRSSKEAVLEVVAQQVYRGEYPWASGGASGGQAALGSLARKYRDAGAEAARCREQLQLLEWEMSQASKYYRHVGMLVSGAICRREGDVQELLARAKTAWLEEVQAGQAGQAGQAAALRRLVEGCAKARMLLAEVDALQQLAQQNGKLDSKAVSLWGQQGGAGA